MLNNRQAGRRRGRGNRPQGNNSGNGSRIDNRARGNAPQLLEKYKNMARDAQLSGDRVMTEYYLQFADHYFRVVAESRARFEENRAPRRDEWQGDDEDGASEGADNNSDAVGYEGEAGTEADASYAQDRQPRRDRQDRGDRQERNDRNDRNDRQPRDARPRDRDNRPPRRREDAAPQGAAQPEHDGAMIDAAVLPPSFAPAPVSADDEAPAPKVTRTRRPRKAAEPAAEAAE